MAHKQPIPLHEIRELKLLVTSRVKVTQRADKPGIRDCDN